MPRMQSPAGYIRSKEVQEILNISPAMIREYVAKGKIKHLVPRGRIHGFYLESDVRKLANELDVFLNLEEETAASSFRIATPADIHISTEDIEEYKPGKHVRLYLAEIGIKPSVHNNLRRKYGAKLIAKFMDTIVDLGTRGVIIENIIAVGATKSGVKLLQHFGLCEVMPLRPDTRLFTLNVKESGSPLILQYKQALQGSGVLKPKRVQATTSQDERMPTGSYTTIAT